MSFEPGTTLEQLRQAAAHFAAERDWDQFHSPRNLLLALVSEVGELADIIRWQGDTEPTIPAQHQQHWADEIADVAIFLVRLADRTGVDLPKAFMDKLAAAGERYPVERFYGSNAKYSDADPADDSDPQSER